MEQALREKGPCLVEIVVDEEQHVYPMVPAGRREQDMMLSGRWR